MKKWVVLFLLLLILCGAAACSRDDYRGEIDSVALIDTGESVDLPQEAYDGIMSILNSGQWVNDLTDCACDYMFKVGDAVVRYHSSCGTFVDITNGRALSLSDKEQAAVNDWLHVN